MNYYKKYTPYLFLLPAAAVLIVFFFIPFFQTFGLSFFDYSSNIYHPTFNGLDNYVKLFKEPIFYKVMCSNWSFLKVLKRIKTLKQKNAPQKAIQPPKVDYQAILSKYDAQAIKNSPIKYFTAAKSLVNDLLNILQQQEIAQAEKISEISRIGLNLNNKFTFSPQLTPEENELLSERQNFLAEMLSVGTDEAKTRLLSVKTQAENFLSSLDKIYYSENYFNELADFENARRPSFSFLIEHLSLVVKDVMAKLEFLAANKDFIIKIAKLQAAWNDNYKAFKMNLREELTLSCSEAGIDAEIYQKWYEDWRMKRFAIEKSFLPLIEFAFKGHFDFIEDVLKILREYISFTM